MFGCAFLHLLPSAAGLSLSEDSYAKFLSARKQSIINILRVWSPAHGTNFKLARLLDGRYLHLCSIFVPALLVGLAIYRLEIL